MKKILTITISIAVVLLFTVGCATTQPVTENQMSPTKGLVMANAHGVFLTAEASEPLPTIDSLEPGEVLAITPANFAEVMDDMQHRLELYVGKTIALEGYVFRHETFPADLLQIARMYITCCADDAVVIGVLAKDPQAATFPTTSWVRAVGTVSTTEYTDVWTGRTSIVALLIPDTIEAIEKPIIQVIYGDADEHTH
jgi:uncharacterized repeat protein (TIGR03943 family)